MIVIVALCGIILGLLAGIYMGKMSSRQNLVELEALKDSSARLIAEKEENFQTLLKEKEDSFQTRLQEKDEIMLTRLQEKDETMNKLLKEKEEVMQVRLEEKEEMMQKRLEEKDEVMQKRLQEKDEVMQKRLQEKDEASKEAAAQLLATHQREIDSLKENHSKILENLENNYKEAILGLQKQFSESSTAMSEQLKNTTEQMLKQRQEEFSQSSGEKLDTLLQPLKESLKSMQEKVTENTTTHNALGGKLSASIQNLLQHTESAQASADKLASMLKGSTKHQGEWGERILKEILETLQLKEGIHFHVQQTLTDEKGETLKNEEGKKGRPDVVLHLDENKDVIIDSKVSLTAYLDYMEAENDEDRKEALRKHIASIEKHVKELEKKDYSGYVSRPRVKLDYVIMFVPNTSALLLATNAKPTLWRDAMEKGVYIADEQTLYAALKIVSITWNQIVQNANQHEVFDLAEEMISRVGQFMAHYNEIGKHLSSALKSHGEGMKKLAEGGQSIPQTCRKLVKLGAKVTKLPKGVSPSLFISSEEEESLSLPASSQD